MGLRLSTQFRSAFLLLLLAAFQALLGGLAGLVGNLAEVVEGQWTAVRFPAPARPGLSIASAIWPWVAVPYRPISASATDSRDGLAALRGSLRPSRPIAAAWPARSLPCVLTPFRWFC